MTTTAIDVNDPKYQRAGKLNKSALMRAGLEARGKDASGPDVFSWVKETFGVELTKSELPGLYNLRKQFKSGKKSAGKPGRKPSANGHVAVTSNGHHKPAVNGPAQMHRTVVAAIEACGGKSELIEYVTGL